jgi:predicted PurR-regulated permease PerM
MSEAQQSKKISVGLVLGWIFGVLFGLTGIVSVFSEPIPGIVMLAMAAILLPPINKLVDKKWKFHLSVGIKIVVIIIGLIIFGSTIDTSNTANQQNNQPQIQQEQKQIISNTEQQKIIQ